MASKATALLSVLFLAVIAIEAHGSDNYSVALESDNVNVTQGSDNVNVTEGSENYNGQTCVYSLYVRTGLRLKAGTDSNISLAVGNAEGTKFSISNLVAWGGLMEQNYDYFEMGNLDIFSGRGPCLTGPICSLDLVSDGTGLFAGWFCDYVEVTSTGLDISCNKKKFKVNTWLQPPRQLSFSADLCNSSYAATSTAISDM